MGAVFAVGFILVVGSVICQSVLWRFRGLGLRTTRDQSCGWYVVGRYFWEPLVIDVNFDSDGGGSTQFDLDVLERSSPGSEDWRREIATCSGGLHSPW